MQILEQLLMILIKMITFFIIASILFWIDMALMIIQLPLMVFGWEPKALFIPMLKDALDV